MDEKPPLRTVIVEGPLALAMRRFEAAGAGEIGLQILNLPQLAARLSGGFHQPAAPEVLEPAIQGALNEKGFREIERVIELPGITRAVARTLQKVWNADIDLEATAAKGGAPRLRDLAVIESRVRAQLPTATLLPRDLRAAALARIDHAPALLGPLRIENISWVPPLWRKLLNALHGIIAVEWITPAVAEKSWFSGVVKSIDLTNDIEQCDVISCADPHHEVVESLRWVRRLLSTNTAKSREIAIAAAAPAIWDEHFLGLAADAGLRIHFTHGIPALSTRDGQRCAALADVLVRGLSEQRVRRLLALSAGERTEFDRLPPAWLRALPRGASLLTLGDWERVLRGMQKSGGPANPETVLLPLLGVLAQGPTAAGEAGTLSLRGRSQTIWQTALRTAPPHAIELALQNIRLADESDPADSVVWGPAAHLSASPRKWVRLLGLTSGGWPRCGMEDAILPDHIIAATQLDPDLVAEADRRCFSIIVGAARGGLALSRSRRNAQGNRLGQIGNRVSWSALGHLSMRLVNRIASWRVHRKPHGSVASPRRPNAGVTGTSTRLRLTTASSAINIHASPVRSAARNRRRRCNCCFEGRSVSSGNTLLVGGRRLNLNSHSRLHPKRSENWSMNCCGEQSMRLNLRLGLRWQIPSKSKRLCTPPPRSFGKNGLWNSRCRRNFYGETQSLSRRKSRFQL